MKFSVRFKIGNRLGAASKYSLREVCVCLVDTCSLNETELCTLFTLRVGETFTNEDIQIRRVK